MPQKIVFWDWTGTLADEAGMDEAVCRAMEGEIAQKMGLPFREGERLFKEHLKSLENTWEWHDYTIHARHFGLDWRRPQETNLGKLNLLPHAREILEYSREMGYRNAMATNAARQVILLRAEYLGVLELFDAVITFDETKAMKSEGEHVKYGLRALSGDAKSSFMVGDNPVQDIYPAKKLGLKTIFCDFGAHLTHYHTEHISNNHKELANADYRITDLLEIKKIIK